MEKLTVENVKNFDTEVDYTTFLDNFEGPLDLLLYLIKEQRIEIKDIFVSQVTDQFLAYMKALPYLDLDKAGEYLSITATIINIKARSLVPPPEDDFGMEWQEDDPETELIEALEEYQMLKEEADKLKERETVGFYFKEPDKDFGNVQVQYKDLTVDGLVAAFQQLMMKRETIKQKPPIREIPKDIYTVKDKITFIRSKVSNVESIKFEELFDINAPKSEIVTTFQAILELLKHQFIKVSQNDLFSEIVIEKNLEKQEDEEIGEIDEYN